MPRNSTAWLFFLLCLVGGLAVHNAVEVRGLAVEAGMVSGLPESVELIQHNIAVICTQLGAPCLFQ